MDDTDWPKSWLGRVRLYRERVAEEVSRINRGRPVPTYYHDTTRLGEDIGWFGRLLANLPTTGTQQ